MVDFELCGEYSDYMVDKMSMVACQLYRNSVPCNDLLVDKSRRA